jgi:hypothetical protein
VTDDCCYAHSLNNRAANVVPNDGVIDWLAIDIAVDGSRPVRLTWVEQEIAAATILANGESAREAGRRVRSDLRQTARRERVERMAEFIQRERASA